MKIDHGAGEHAFVLLHGLGNNHESWTYVVDELTEKPHRVVAFDLLGFGDAPKPAVDYTPRDHADAVIATMDALGLTNVILAGHSMGSIVAVEVAKQRPDLVRSLVLLGAPLYRKLPRRGPLARLTRTQSRYFTIFRFLRRNPDLTITAAEAADRFLILLKGMEITEETWPAFTKSLSNTIMQTKSYQDVRASEVPTLLVYGVLDVFVIKKHLKRLAHENRRFVTLQTTLGPHEITPLEGKRIADLLVDQIDDPAAGEKPSTGDRPRG